MNYNRINGLWRTNSILGSQNLSLYAWIGGFNLEYGNHENGNLEYRKRYLEFNLENGIIESPIIIPHTPPHTHTLPPHPHTHTPTNPQTRWRSRGSPLPRFFSRLLFSRKKFRERRYRDLRNTYLRLMTFPLHMLDCSLKNNLNYFYLPFSFKRRTPSHSFERVKEKHWSNLIIQFHLTARQT